MWLFSFLNFKLGLGFQSSVSPIMEGIVDLHNHIFFFLILVFVFVFWVFGNILYSFWWKVSHPASESDLEERVTLASLRHVSHSTSLEVIWTVIPSLILAAIAVPSLTLLYAMDEIMEPTLTLKVVGHQWYWTYQYSNCISQMHYSGLEHPELIPESLWNRTWANAAAFYNTYLVSDDVEKLAKFPEKPVPFLFEDWALEEACAKRSDFGWIDPVAMFSESYLKNNSLDSNTISLYPRAKLDNLLIEVRPSIPKPMQYGFSGKELYEKGQRALKGVDIVDPERISTQKLYAWLVNKYPDHKKPYVPNRHDLVRVQPYNRSNFVWTVTYPKKLMFETLEGRLNKTIDSLLPVGYHDIKWWNELWLRKVIAGKVVEALHTGIDLSGRGDQLPGVQFDSYMLNEEELSAVGDYRLLEVDEPIVLPTNTHIRLLITADDVIHSFAVPQLGIKVDAVPGRLNQQGVFIKRRGSFYGQCSELCGVNHGFMPIVIKAVSMKEFVSWYLHKFDSLHPEYGMKLVDKEEVQAFLKKGAYPASFAEFFSQDRLTVPESLVGDKTDSVFNLPHSSSLALNTTLGFIVDRFVHAHPGLLELNWGLVQFEGASNYLGEGWKFSPMEGVLNGPSKGVKGPLLDWTNPMIYKRVVIADPARFIKEVRFAPSLWTLKTMKQIASSGATEPIPAPINS